MAWTNFWTIFFTILSGGGGSTKGGVGCRISVLREGWEVVLLLREG